MRPIEQTVEDFHGYADANAYCAKNGNIALTIGSRAIGSSIANAWSDKLLCVCQMGIAEITATKNGADTSFFFWSWPEKNISAVTPTVWITEPGKTAHADLTCPTEDEAPPIAVVKIAEEKEANGLRFNQYLSFCLMEEDLVVYKTELFNPIVMENVFLEEIRRYPDFTLAR